MGCDERRGGGGHGANHGFRIKRAKVSGPRFVAGSREGIRKVAQTSVCDSNRLSA